MIMTVIKDFFFLLPLPVVHVLLDVSIDILTISGPWNNHVVPVDITRVQATHCM